MSATEEEEEEGAGEDRAGEGIRVWCEEARLRIALYYYIQEEEGRKEEACESIRRREFTDRRRGKERAASSSSSSSSAASFSTSLHSLRGLYRQLATEEGDGGGERASFTPSSSPKRTFSLSFPPFGPLPLTASFFSLSLPSSFLGFWSGAFAASSPYS